MGQGKYSGVPKALSVQKVTNSQIENNFARAVSASRCARGTLASFQMNLFGWFGTLIWYWYDIIISSSRSWHRGLQILCHISVMSTKCMRTVPSWLCYNIISFISHVIYLIFGLNLLESMLLWVSLKSLLYFLIRTPIAIGCIWFLKETLRQTSQSVYKRCKARLGRAQTFPHKVLREKWWEISIDSADSATDMDTSSCQDFFGQSELFIRSFTQPGCFGQSGFRLRGRVRWRGVFIWGTCKNRRTCFRVRHHLV